MKTLSLTLFSAILMSSGAGLSAADCGPSGCGPTVVSSCQSCMPSCDVCGGQGGYCCDGGEAIDIDSLTPLAQSKQLYNALQARLIFDVPEDADVYLSGQRMSTAGPNRVFLVAVNDPKAVYKYEIQVNVVRGGKMYYKKEVIKILRAGAILAVKVEAPPVEYGEIPVFVMAMAVVMPGGIGEAVAPIPEVEAPAPPADLPAATEATTSTSQQKITDKA